MTEIIHSLIEVSFSHPFPSIVQFSSVSQSCLTLTYPRGFPDDSGGKESACNAGDPGSVPGLGRCPGEGNGNSLQYSWLGNPIDRGVWLHCVVSQRSRTRLSDSTTIVDSQCGAHLFGITLYSSVVALCGTTWHFSV